MTKLVLPALVIALMGCDVERSRSANDAVPAAEPAGTSLRPGEVQGGLALSSNAAEPIAGSRPVLSATCDQHARVLIYFGLVKRPTSPPPLRGNYATLTFDDRAPVRIDLAWSGDTGWTSREIAEGDNGRLAVAIARARSVRLSGLTNLAAETIRWTVDLPAADRERFVATCTDRAAMERGRLAEEQFQRERERDPIVLAQRRRGREINRRLLANYEIRAQRCRDYEAAGYRANSCPPARPALVPVD